MLGGDSVAVRDWSILLSHCQKKSAITGTGDQSLRCIYSRVPVCTYKIFL